MGHKKSGKNPSGVEPMVRRGVTGGEGKAPTMSGIWRERTKTDGKSRRGESRGGSGAVQLINLRGGRSF